MHLRWSLHLHKFTIHHNAENQLSSWMFSSYWEMRWLDYPARYRLCSMKLHHTSRLILIKIKFVAKTIFGLCLSSALSEQQSMSYFNFFFYDVDYLRWQRPWEYWVLSWKIQSGLLVISDFIVWKPFIEIPFLWKIFPWTKGHIWVYFPSNYRYIHLYVRPYIIYLCETSQGEVFWLNSRNFLSFIRR